ncbi:MAG: DUF1592 domain-containing protein [Isosphaeraceae bacterium]
MKTRRFAGIGLGLAVIAGVIATAVAPTGGSTGAQQVASPRDDFQARVLPVLEKYCVDCHAKGSAEAGVVLDRYADQASALKDEKTWVRVLDAIESRLMPPPDEKQPTLDEFDAVANWIEKDYLAARCREKKATAPVVIRRLNRREYQYTVHDLLGIDLDVAADFPADEIGFGYDNVGSALNISPVHVEKYLDAAEAATDRAVVVPDYGDLPPIELIGLRTYPLPPDKPVEFDHTLKPGLYFVHFSLVRVGVAEAVPPPRLVVGLGQDRRTVTATSVQDETVVYRYWLNVAPGDKSAYVALAPGEAARENVARPAQVTAAVSGDQRYGGDRGHHVDSMVVKGPVPFDRATLPESHRRILFVTPGPDEKSRLEAGRAIVARFAERAFRRPVRDEEIERLHGMFRLALDRGESFERAVQLALTAALTSPQFLFLIEPEETAQDRPLTEYELASRLSYFLWSSMPDDELFRHAATGTLRMNLRGQVTRMLDDPKSRRFVENFAGQWLQLRRLAGVNPDANLFPGFDAKLRDSMRRETETYLDHVVREDRSVLELIDSDYTFLDEAMARHYGLPGVSGPAFRKVTLDDRRRGGVLTQASVLTLTSNPNRTSPVKRGQWILQQILGTPPPPPPPEVAKLDDSKEAADASSLRDRMEVHRTNPQCAACHQQMDPIGFALENYDAVGRWRTADGGFPVDPSGELAGGRKFADAQELKSILRDTGAKKFTKCLIENLLTYALGRGLDAYDSCTVEDIRSAVVADHYRARTILQEIVASPAFRNRGVSR